MRKVVLLFLVGVGYMVLPVFMFLNWIGRSWYVESAEKFLRHRD